MSRPARTVKTVDEFNETLEQLELLIGRDSAKKAVDFFEGMNIYFPKRIGLHELHEQIYEELRNGATYHDAAVKYGYTKSHIRKIEHKITDRRRQKAQLAFLNRISASFRVEQRITRNINLDRGNCFMAAEAELEGIKRRVKKLLALPKSPNENEAVAALEKARALMDEYRLTEGECLYTRQSVKAAKRLSS
jgi:hypothetical protein